MNMPLGKLTLNSGFKRYNYIQTLTYPKPKRNTKPRQTNKPLQKMLRGYPLCAEPREE